MRNEPPITINHRRKRNETAAATRAKKTLKYRGVAVSNERTNKELNEASKKHIPYQYPKETLRGVKQAQCSDYDKTLISQFALIRFGAGRCQLPWMFWQPFSSELRSNSH